MLFVIMLDFLFGYYKLFLCDASAVAQFMLEKKIVYRKFKRDKDGASFLIRKKTYKKFKEDFDCFGATISKEYGLPKILRLYRKRIGIPLGLLLFSALMFLSSLFIWDMDINGNENISDDEIIALLDSYGCRIGAYIPSLDLYSICNRCMLDSGKISFISVNLKGTVAHVELIERKINEKTEKPKAGNIIASCDGIVSYYTVTNGECVITPGQQVKKGELLISGICGEVTDDSKTVLAEGSVYALTSRTLSVTVPYEYPKKTYTGTTFSEKYANIFGNNIKLYSNSGNLEQDCDTIDNKYNGYTVEKFRYRWIILGRIELPIIIDEKRYSEYEWCIDFLSDEQALKTAKEEMALLQRNEIGKADILATNTETEIIEQNDKKYLRLTVEYKCLEDIAVQSEILIGE